MKIAVVVYLFYYDLWPEFREAIRNVRTVHPSADVFVSFNTDDWRTREAIEAQVHRDFPTAQLESVPNIGMDVGPFLLWMNEVYARDLKYDAVLKLHTKKCFGSIGPSRGDRWRQRLINAVAGSPETVKRCTDLLMNPLTPMVGDGVSIIGGVSRAEKAIRKVRKMLKLGRSGEYFIAGTMFWVRMDLLRRYLPAELVCDLYDLMPEGYLSDGSVAHALERAFGYMVEHSGGRIVPV